jgi:hypothetical protein
MALHKGGGYATPIPIDTCTSGDRPGQAVGWPVLGATRFGPSEPVPAGPGARVEDHPGHPAKRSSPALEAHGEFANSLVGWASPTIRSYEPVGRAHPTKTPKRAPEGGTVPAWCSFTSTRCARPPPRTQWPRLPWGRSARQMQGIRAPPFPESLQSRFTTKIQQTKIPFSDSGRGGGLVSLPGDQPAVPGCSG